MTRLRTGHVFVRSSVTREPGDTHKQESEHTVKTKILVEITLDKQPESAGEVQALLDDITENYGRATAALSFTPSTGLAFVESVRLVGLTADTAQLSGDVLVNAANRRRGLGLDDAVVQQLRTAAAFVRSAVQS